MATGGLRLGSAARRPAGPSPGGPDRWPAAARAAGRELLRFPGRDVAALPSGRRVVAAPLWRLGGASSRWPSACRRPWQYSADRPRRTCPAERTCCCPRLVSSATVSVRLVCAVHVRSGDHLGYDWTDLGLRGPLPHPVRWCRLPPRRPVPGSSRSARSWRSRPRPPGCCLQWWWPARAAPPWRLGPGRSRPQPPRLPPLHPAGPPPRLRPPASAAATATRARGPAPGPGSPASSPAPRP